MLLYALTILTGSFLLFQIQPVIAKIILPWFGGAAAVWTTCLLFFQAGLAGGYLYAHSLVSRLQPGRQLLVHGGLLAASLLALPVMPAETWKPPGPEDPALRILGLLAASIGLPYLLLSAGGPLVQAWYSRAHHGASPYRLYAMANAGSLLALLTYPVLVEPWLATRRQTQIWAAAYVGFVVLMMAVALRIRRAPAEPAVRGRTESASPPPSWGLRSLWMALAGTASVLLLAVTNHVTKDVAPLPFLWILPLTLYLVTLIICFEREHWYDRRWFLRLLALALAGMVCGISGFGTVISLPTIVLLFSAGLLICCMVCHGELARLKPPPDHLTSFYLMVAAGGALGGVFVGLIAPRWFKGYWELPAGMAACAFLAVLTTSRETRYRRLAPAAALPVLAGVAWLLATSGGFVAPSRLTLRNFYGVLRVNDVDEHTAMARRRLMHGSINHGEQFLSAERRQEPTSYYGPQSGVSLAIRQMSQQGPLRVGVIGLGAGVLAAYGRFGDYYRFYELNPLVADIARRKFTFLADSSARCEIDLGDARLALEREPPQAFDVLAVDAFSGDAIPVHLLTTEAIRLYFRHLQPEGILAIHVSSKYLDLASMVDCAARAVGKKTLVITDPGDSAALLLRSTWVLAAEDGETLRNPELRRAGAGAPALREVRPWTDDYSNLLELLR